MSTSYLSFSFLFQALICVSSFLSFQPVNIAVNHVMKPASESTIFCILIYHQVACKAI